MAIISCHPRSRSWFPPWAGAAITALAVVLACRPERETPASLVVVDDAGDTVRLEAPARRIVSLVPATTEILFAIGAGPHLVGGTRWDDYPPEAAGIPDAGDGISPNLEAVLGRDPDLVVMYHSGSNAGAAERLRQLGIPAVRLTVDRLADVGRLARLLGQLAGTGPKADSVARVLDSAVAEASVSTPADPVRLAVVAWDQPPMVIGAGSFLSELVERAGAVNVFGDLAEPSVQISIEAVVARNPDAILVSSDGPPAIAGRPEWRVVPAVRDQRFIRVTSSAFSRPSPRAAEAIRELRSKLEQFQR